LAFVPLPTSLGLTKIDITYTQVLQEETSFPIIPRSETEPEICMKMLRNLSEKLGAKLPSTTLGYSMVRISHLDNAFLETLELEASPEKGQQLKQKDKKERQKKTKKN